MADYTSDEDEAEYTPGPEKKAARSAPGKRLFTETSRHANGGPPPGMDPGKRNLDKGQRDTQSDEVAEEGNERQGGSPSNSKKQKHDNGYDLDDSSGHGIGTPPLTSSNNNNYMFFFCLGGGGSHLTRCLHMVCLQTNQLWGLRAVLAAGRARPVTLAAQAEEAGTQMTHAPARCGAVMGWRLPWSGLKRVRKL